MAKRQAQIEVTLRDRASAGLKRMAGVTGALTKAFGLLSAAATTVSAVIGVRFLSGAIKSAGDFTEAMSAVSAVTGASTEELNLLREAANQAGATTRFTATEAANGLEELARSGQTANEAIATLNPVLALASGNQQTVADSAIQVTTALNAFGLAAEDAGRVSDVYTRAAQRSAQTTGQLAQAMTTVAPVARQAGLDVEETSALIGRLADQGFRGERAGTALRNALSQLQDPSSKFSRELDNAGITTRDFIEVIDELAKGGKDAEVAIRALGLEAAPAIQSLVSGGGPALQGLVQELRNAEGASLQAAAALEDNLPGALRGLNSAVDAARRKLVEPLVDKLTDDIQAFADEVRKFVDSDALSNLQKFLVDVFDSGRAAVLEFVKQIDFADVQRRIKEFVDSSAERLAAFRESVEGLSAGWDRTIGIVQMGVGALGTAYNGLGIIISGTVDLIVGALKRQMQAFNIGTAGVVPFFRKAADELELVQQDVRETTRNFIDSAAESNEQIAEGFRRFQEAGQQAAREVKAGMHAAADGVDRVATSAQDADEAANQLKTDLFLLGQSGESLGLGMEGAADGIESAKDQLVEFEKVTGDFGNGIETRLIPKIQTVGTESNKAAEELKKAWESGEEGLDKTAESGQRAAESVEQVGEAAEKTERRFGAAGSAIAGILNSWRTLSEGAAKAVEAFVSSATLNSVQGYFAKLGDFTSRLRETQQQQIAEAERIREYYDQTGDSLGFVTQAQSLLNREVRLLDPSKVEELERAVAAARAEMDAARQSSADLVRELEDDLLRLQGRTEEIEQRRQQLKREEIRLQLRSNEIDDETRRNLEQALRLMEQKAQLQREQAAEAARSAGDNEAAAKAAEREAEATERTADAAERTQRSRTSTVGDGTLRIELTTRASDNGAPNFSQADLAQIATRITPLILQELRSSQGVGL